MFSFFLNFIACLSLVASPIFRFLKHGVISCGHVSSSLFWLVPRRIYGVVTKRARRIYGVVTKRASNFHST